MCRKDRECRSVGLTLLYTRAPPESGYTHDRKEWLCSHLIWKRVSSVRPLWATKPGRRGTPLDELVPVLIARDRERTTGDAILDNMTARAIGEQWMLRFNGGATRYL